jgi:hypothetical protein
MPNFTVGVAPVALAVHPAYALVIAITLTADALPA